MCMTTMAGKTKPNTMTILWSCVAVVLLATIQTASSAAVEIFPSGTQSVRLGDSLSILCRVGSKVQVCRVAIPGERSMYLSPGQLAEDGIEYYGSGKDSGQCGVTIARVKESHSGVFTCSMMTDASRLEVTANMTIVVAKPPKKPEIYLSPGFRGDRKYKSGDMLEISCVARSGRPAANLSLFLDDETIGYDARTSYDLDRNNNTIASTNVSRSVDWTDNGKMVRCVAHHLALDQPLETKQELQVLFAPQEQPVLERFGYVIGRVGIVNVTVHANPRPSFVWRVNGEKINEGRQDESNRLESLVSDMGKGTWLVKLKIDNVQKSDTEKEYILEARNDEGTTTYHVVLSTSVEPSGVDLDAGSIIGIAVGVLVLILVVFLIIFARATGRWCFAARRRGDEETAGGAGAGSEAHITPGDDEDDHDDHPHIIDEKSPHGGQENPIHASTEYVNGRTDIKELQRKDEKADTPV